MSFESEEEGLVRGWGVVRNQPPWHLAGIFPTEAEAEIRRNELGSDYIVRYGQGREEFDEFYWNEAQNSTKLGSPPA